MRMIDPARRFFVYPFLLRQFAHSVGKGRLETVLKSFSPEKRNEEIQLQHPSAVVIFW